MLSNGDARIGAITSNTALQRTQAQGTGIGSDPDLQALSTAAGYSQALYDEVLLQFDVTPTASGNLAFQYVFGSEEYPDFAPSPGEACSCVCTCRCSCSRKSIKCCLQGLVGDRTGQPRQRRTQLFKVLLCTLPCMLIFSDKTFKAVCWLRLCQLQLQQHS